MPHQLIQPIVISQMLRMHSDAAGARQLFCQLTINVLTMWRFDWTWCPPLANQYVNSKWVFHCRFECVLFGVWHQKRNAENNVYNWQQHWSRFLLPFTSHCDTIRISSHKLKTFWGGVMCIAHTAHQTPNMKHENNNRSIFRLVWSFFSSSSSSSLVGIFLRLRSWFLFERCCCDCETKASQRYTAAAANLHWIIYSLRLMNRSAAHCCAPIVRPYTQTQTSTALIRRLLASLVRTSTSEALQFLF